MAENGSKKGDDLLVAALAGGKSVREACELANVSERTAFRRLDDHTFRRRVAEARACLVERALGQLSEGTTEAATVLRALLQSASESIRLGACRAILEAGGKLRAEVDLDARLSALEAAQSERKP